MKINLKLQLEKVLELEELFWEYKDVFAWMYKDLKGFPLELAQRKIELNITIPLAHHAKYRLIQIMLLTTSFIQLVEEATWLSLIMVAPKNNGKLKICVDFKKVNATMKKDHFSLPIIDKVLNIMARCEAYSFWMDIMGIIKYS